MASVDDFGCSFGETDEENNDGRKRKLYHIVDDDNSRIKVPKSHPDSSFSQSYDENCLNDYFTSNEEASIMADKMAIGGLVSPESLLIEEITVENVIESISSSIVHENTTDELFSDSDNANDSTQKSNDIVGSNEYHDEIDFKDYSPVLSASNLPGDVICSEKASITAKPVETNFPVSSHYCAKTNSTEASAIVECNFDAALLSNLETMKNRIDSNDKEASKETTKNIELNRSKCIPSLNEYSSDAKSSSIPLTAAESVLELISEVIASEKREANESCANECCELVTKFVKSKDIEKLPQTMLNVENTLIESAVKTVENIAKAQELSNVSESSHVERQLQSSCVPILTSGTAEMQIEGIRESNLEIKLTMFDSNVKMKSEHSNCSKPDASTITIQGSDLEAESERKFERKADTVPDGKTARISKPISICTVSEGAFKSPKSGLKVSLTDAASTFSSMSPSTTSDMTQLTSAASKSAPSWPQMASSTALIASTAAQITSNKLQISLVPCVNAGLPAPSSGLPLVSSQSPKKRGRPTKAMVAAREAYRQSQVQLLQRKYSLKPLSIVIPSDFCQSSETLKNDDLSNTATSDSEQRIMKSKLEICDANGNNLTVNQIVEYEWPIQGGKLYMIQEQISSFLGVQSFQRKYPDVKRRPLDSEERAYLIDSGFVSESVCKLGITAVCSAQILDVMCTDFPEKHEELRKYMREKQIKQLSFKPKASVDGLGYKLLKAESSKQDLKNRALESASSWNSTLNKSRKEDRRCAIDLQSYIVHYPKSKKQNINAQMPKIGSYPVPILPGQFCDHYKEYTAIELNYMPLNSVLFGPLKHLLDAKHADGSLADSDDSFSSDDSSTTSEDSQTSEYTVEDIDEDIMNLDKSVLVVKLPDSGLSMGDDCDVADGVRETISKDSVKIFCKICLGDETRNKENVPEVLICCSQCSSANHPTCLNLPLDMVPHIQSYKWLCIDCKNCSCCQEYSDEDKMLFCDVCDRGFHIYCIGLRKVPLGSWQCQECVTVESIRSNHGNKVPVPCTNVSISI